VARVQKDKTNRTNKTRYFSENVPMFAGILNFLHQGNAKRTAKKSMM
jgi:hypothetical protein